VTNRTAANRYAKALFDVALAEKVDLESIEQQPAFLMSRQMRQHPAGTHPSPKVVERHRLVVLRRRRNGKSRPDDRQAAAHAADFIVGSTSARL